MLRRGVVGLFVMYKSANGTKGRGIECPNCLYLPAILEPMRRTVGARNLKYWYTPHRRFPPVTATLNVHWGASNT